MNDQMAVYLTIDDPEDVGQVQDAYCVLTEVHSNFRSKTLLVIFECWRSREAFLKGRKPFNAIKVTFEPDQGGKEYFQQYGIDGAGLHLGKAVLDFCNEHCDIIMGSKPATGPEEVADESS